MDVYSGTHWNTKFETKECEKFDDVGLISQNITIKAILSHKWPNIFGQYVAYIFMMNSSFYNALLPSRITQKHMYNFLYPENGLFCIVFYSHFGDLLKSNFWFLLTT